MLEKTVGCTFAIGSGSGSGLVACCEGPIYHIGAILGAAISQMSSARFQWRLPDRFAHMVKHFRSSEWKRDFFVMVSASGVVAAFGAYG